MIFLERIAGRFIRPALRRLVATARVRRDAATSAGIAAALLLICSANPAVAVSPPSITKNFSAASVNISSSATLTFTITNPNGAVDLTGVSFNDTLPAGLIFANPDSLTGTCDPGIFTLGVSNISLVGGTILAASSCTFSVDVFAISAGTQVNTTDPVTSNEGGTGNTATATIVVTVPQPTIAKSFGAATIPVTGSTTLSFTIDNPGLTTLTGIGFTDAFPAGLVVSSPNGVTGSCGGGVITATAGSATASLSGATVGPGQSCTFSLGVTATTQGTKINVTGAITSNEGGTGATSNAATLGVNAANGSTTVLASSSNPSSFGQAVTFTATVTSGGGTPTGTVSFLDGGTVVATVALAAGVASLTTSTLAVGSHSMTASYGGGGGFVASASAVLTQAVSVPADSIKLRALQLVVTKIEAQSSGQAVSSSIDGAIGEGFAGGGPPVTASDGGFRFSFSADSQDGARAVREGDRARVAEAFAALGYGPREKVFKATPAPPPAPKDWLGWIEVHGTGWNTSAQTGDIRGGQVNTLAGVTRRVSADLLIGVLGGYENFDYTSRLLDGRLKGGGWTVGAYLGWRFMPGIRFDAGIARSGISYDGVAGLAAASFPGERWIATAALIGTYRMRQGFEIEPSARVYALWEREKGYTDNLGITQAERSFSNGRASAGAKVAYPWMWTSTTTVSPYVGLYGDYYFNRDDATLPIAPLLPTQFIQGWSARVAAGVGASLAAGAKLSLGGEVGGLGSGQFTNWSVRGRAAVPF